MATASTFHVDYGWSIRESTLFFLFISWHSLRETVFLIWNSWQQRIWFELRNYRVQSVQCYANVSSKVDLPIVEIDRSIPSLTPPPGTVIYTVGLYIYKKLRFSNHHQLFCIYLLLKWNPIVNCFSRVSLNCFDESPSLYLKGVLDFCFERPNNNA